MKLPSLLKKTEKKSQKPLVDCNHDWALVAKTFVEPKPISLPNSPELTELSMTGMTTLLFQCSKCKGFQQEQMKGVESTALINLMDKVDISGPEYIMKDGKTYILMPYKKQENVPLR